MKHHRIVCVAAALVVASPVSLAPVFAQAVTPLVDSAWLKQHLSTPGVVVLSARLRAPRSVYEKGHIPGAVYTDYAKDGWRAKDKSGVPAMLASVAKLETLIGSLGISNASHVVIAPAGMNALDMGAATRLYWTFKVLGHDKVSILDGGWVAWSKVDKNTKRPDNPIAKGGVTPKKAVFKASLRKDMLVSDDDVKTAMNGKVSLVENRPSDFYLGISKSPAAAKAGTIPGAKNVEERWLTKNGGGRFRDKVQLEKIYKAAGVSTQGDQITFCNTGHWASLGWFASSEILGNKKARMYDGSMAAYTRRKDLPLDQKIK
ncbi:MAG: sulfurtransferase [Beijerinckiaceae bacterium]|jgi:thiosulfate/3-mercaptopyruvate sulfurtransferase|nr:sulfurtransferase [Beijerinckiaceae bacterium]